jgi:uncharacterized protein YecE (DUF72 family)
LRIFAIPFSFGNALFSELFHFNFCIKFPDNHVHWKALFCNIQATRLFIEPAIGGSQNDELDKVQLPAAKRMQKNLPDRIPDTCMNRSNFGGRHSHKAKKQTFRTIRDQDN